MMAIFSISNIDNTFAIILHIYPSHNKTGQIHWTYATLNITLNIIYDAPMPQSISRIRIQHVSDALGYFTDTYRPSI